MSQMFNPWKGKHFMNSILLQVTGLAIAIEGAGNLSGI